MSADPTKCQDGLPTDPVQNVASDGRAGQPIGPLSVYYSLFAKDEPMESRRAIYENDRSIGRILVKSLPPPHSVRSISRVLRNIEGFKASDTSELFVPLWSRCAEKDAARVSLSSHLGPGLSLEEPMALIVESEGSLRSKETVHNSSKILDTCEISYVHYRLYSEEGALVSKSSFKEEDPWLGRINILSIKPPQTMTSLKARIARVEAVRSAGVQLLESIFSEKALNDGAISFVGNSYPGRKEAQPMAFICNPLDQATTSGRVLTTRKGVNKSSSPNIFWAPSANINRSGNMVKPLYIYYRVYGKGGPIESKSPIYNNDHSIGRLFITSVTPPHTAGSLRRNLCKIEGIDLSPASHLFTSLWSQKFCEDSYRLPLSENAYPGSSEHDPIVLVIDSEESTSSQYLSQQMLQVSDTTKVAFVYYRIFSEDGEVTSKRAFDKDEPSLGRINILAIKPPHTVKSLKECIAKGESLRIITDVFPDVWLYTNLFSENPMSDGSIPLHEDFYPGCEEGEPMVLVYEQDE